MEARLVAWARAVKACQRGTPPATRVPVLWLFTDERRLTDPLAAIRALPTGLAGVIFRHDASAGRVALGRLVAQACRSRRLALAVAGDWRLAASLRAGVHLRPGDPPARSRRGLVTAAAHDWAELVRARRRGARLVFLSPVFATASHPDAVTLGCLRWSAMAGRARLPVLALGGINARTARRLPRRLCAGAGAIAALLA